MDIEHARPSKWASFWQYAIAPLFLAISTAIFYAPSLTYAFQFDDLANIVKFYDIRHKTIGELFFFSQRWISYWLNTRYYALGKFEPFWYRFGNICFHTISGLLIYAVLFVALSRYTKTSFFARHAQAIATVTALLFLLHPVQTQTVSYVIQGQLEGLAFLSMMLASLLLLCFSGTKSKKTRRICALLLFALAPFAACTKEISIVIPALLVLMDWFFCAQGNLRLLLKRWWLHAIFAGVLWGTLLYFLKPAFFANIFGLNMAIRNNVGNVLTENPTDLITVWPFLISQFKVIAHYLHIFVWPFSMSVEYDWKMARHVYDPEVVFPFAALALLGGYLLQRLRKNRIDLISFGFLWFFMIILPRSSFIPSTELLVDYKTYGASFGIFFLCAAALVFVFNLISARIAQYEQQVSYAAMLAVACAFGFATYQRNTVWRSGEEFWGDVIAHAPNKARAYNNLGVALAEKNQFAAALPYFQKAMEMDTHYPDPVNNLSVAYGALGQVDNAIAVMKKSIQMQPGYPEGYNNIASFYMAKREFKLAHENLKTAIKMRPHYGKAYFNLGRLLLEEGRREEAWEAFRSCCSRADFDNEVGFSAYANMSFELKKFDDAITGYTKLLTITPNNTEVHLNLANAYYSKQEYEKAKAQYGRLLALSPHDARAHFNLGEVYFAQRDDARALACYERARDLNQGIPQVYLRLAQTMGHMGRLGESQTILEAFLKSNPPPQLEAMAKETLTRLAALRKKTGEHVRA